MRHLRLLTALAVLGLSSTFAQQLETERISGRETAAREVLIKLQPGTTVEQLKQEFDADLAQPVGNSGLIRLRSRSRNAASLVSDAGRSPLAVWAEPNYIIRVAETVPDDPIFGELWGLRNMAQPVNGHAGGTPFADIEATKAWDITTGSAQMLVGVIDTGIDYNHPDLAPNIWTAPAPYQITIGDVTLNCPAGSHGFNAFAFSCDPRDDNNHGTHVAGTIGARGNNLLGVTGINWTTSIVGFKFLNSSGFGSTADAINAIEAAVQMKAQGINIRILNASWGGLSASAPLQEAIDHASDMLFVAAAGNLELDNDGANPFYPASYASPNIVSVAATDNQDKLAAFSNFGLTKVHLGAPGVDIKSTILGAGYGYLDGTSMAAPHVAGTAALLLSKCSLTTPDLKSALLNTVDGVSSLAGKTITGGRLNAYRALVYCGASATQSFTLSASPASFIVTAGETRTSQIAVAFQDGFAGEVILSAVGAPAGVSVVFSPPTLTSSGTSTLTLLTSPSTPAGTFAIIVHGVGGGFDYTQRLNLTVNVPDFTLSASPASMTVVKGSAASTTISVGALFGFNGIVNLSASGMPSGIGATFSRDALTGGGNSVLTFTASASTETGAYLVTVQGLSGGALTHTATVILNVVAPDFAISASPGSLALTGGAASNSTISVIALHGFGGAVNLTVSGMPTGVTASLFPAVVTAPGSSILNVTTAASTNAGTYPITVQGVSGALVRTATVNLTVAAPLVAATASLVTGQIDVPYSQSLSASGGVAPYRWTVYSGRLPRGLSLNESTGVISGTPTATINSLFTFQVTDSTTPVAKIAFVTLLLNITDGGVTITTAALASGQVGTVYSQTLSAIGGIPPYTWTLPAGSALPNGLTLSPATGQISGTPAAPMNGPLTFLVTDASTPARSATKVLTLTVAPLTLSITTASLASGQVGVAYAQGLAATGGTGSYAWSILSGSLPNGLALNPATGQISGTPTSGANASLTFRVADSGSPAQSATKALTLVVTTPPLSIATTSLAIGQVGATYSQTLSASGGTGSYSWSIAGGALPNGLTLNPSTGSIGGIPTVAASIPVTFRVTDGSLPTQAVTKVLTLTVTQPVLAITTASLPSGQAGSAYSHTLTAGGGTGSYSWTVIGGVLPNGLTLHPATGQISGIPTTGASVSLTFRVTDSSLPAQTATKTFTLTVAPSGLTITTVALASGQLGVPYAQTLMATGGTAPYRWTALSGRPPRGLALDESTGLISGIPSATGTTALIFQVTDSSVPAAKTATASLPLTVTEGGGFAITTVSLAAGQIGAAYLQTLAAAGGTAPYTWSIVAGGTLPNGLTLSPSTGQISGTPTAAVNSSFTFRVTDAGLQTAVKVLNLTVTQAAFTITTAALPAGQIGAGYSQTLTAAGGIAPYTWSLAPGSVMPSGLTLTAATGQISGTPTAAASTSLTFWVTDSSSPTQTATKVLMLVIAMPGGRDQR